MNKFLIFLSLCFSLVLTGCHKVEATLIVYEQGTDKIIHKFNDSQISLFDRYTMFSIARNMPLSSPLIHCNLNGLVYEYSPNFKGDLRFAKGTSYSCKYLIESK